jgi:transcriptional repressor NrdR
MRCPYCGGADTQVKDSRPTEDDAAIRRRRACLACGGRFTTFERVQLRELAVIKRSGRRAPFDRDKLSRSVEIALRKRPVAPERIERMVSGIVRQLESSGEQDIPAQQIGELVMEALKGIDDVAYVRFASVYKNFREAKDFETFLGELAERGDPARVAERVANGLQDAAEVAEDTAAATEESEQTTKSSEAAKPTEPAEPAEPARTGAERSEPAKRASIAAEE